LFQALTQIWGSQCQYDLSHLRNQTCLPPIRVRAFADPYPSMQGGRDSFTSPHIDHSLPGPGPAKKRKRNSASQRHWDDPEQQSNTLPYDEDEADRTIEEVIVVDDAEEEEEESRELTQNDIWDDSALIAAWESAMAEYEVSRPLIAFASLWFVLTIATKRLFTVREKIGRRNP
jgi:hypothetical protein